MAASLLYRSRNPTNPGEEEKKKIKNKKRPSTAPTCEWSSPPRTKVLKIPGLLWWGVAETAGWSGIVIGARDGLLAYPRSSLEVGVGVAVMVNQILVNDLNSITHREDNRADLERERPREKTLRAVKKVRVPRTAPRPGRVACFPLGPPAISPG